MKITKPSFLALVLCFLCVSCVRCVPEVEDLASPSLQYDFYRSSCPVAEKIIRDIVRTIHSARLDLAPSLLRLVFHDCFIQGCDASVLLDAIDGFESEKEAPPNESLKGFDAVDFIKSELERVCPGIVSCADIVVLAGRESVVLAGGPFYPLLTGRRDSNVSYAQSATNELPSPDQDLSSTLSAFASKGFNVKETVALLGAHSFGMVHCKFFKNRLYNFHGTNRPDPSLDPAFLSHMRSVCSDSPPPFPSPTQPPSPSHLDLFSSLSENSGLRMDYDGPGEEFGSLYYRSLLQNRGILFVDQQLTAEEGSKGWVRAYASSTPLFRKDFAVTMMKLSNLKVLTPPQGLIRLHCARID